MLRMGVGKRLLQSRELDRPESALDCLGLPSNYTEGRLRISGARARLELPTIVAETGLVEECHCLPRFPLID